VFHAHGAGTGGSVVFRRKLSRPQYLKVLGEQQSCIAAIEACASISDHSITALIGGTLILLAAMTRKAFFDDATLLRLDREPLAAKGRAAAVAYRGLPRRRPRLAVMKHATAVG
jgi:hypothetical protein